VEANGLPRTSTAKARWLLLGLCVLLRVVSLVRPCLSDDEAIYGVVAREMLSGRVLYRDVVDHKPPLIYVTYAVTQAIGGPSGGMRLLHLLTILTVFATALLLGDLTRRLRPSADPRASFFASLLYVLFTTTLLDFDSLAANCELFMMLPLVASLNLYVRGVRDARGSLLAASGALVAVATFYKYQAAIHLPLYAAYLLMIHRQRLARGLAGVAALALGFLAVAGAGVALLSAFGSLPSAWFWFRFNFAYIKEGLDPFETLRRAVIRVSFVVGAASFLWFLGLKEVVHASRRRTVSTPEGELTWLTLGWLGASLAAITVGGRFFGHYFHQATAPLAVLAAPGALELWHRRRGLVLAWIGIPVAAFFLVAAFHRQVMAAARAPDPDYGALTRFVAAHSAPGESLVVWGNSPVLYFESERPLGSRFVFSNYLTGLSPATRTQSDPKVDASANVVPESWDMFEADLAARRPPLFVDLSPGDVAGYGKFPLSRFPRLERLVTRDYEVLGEVAGGRIWRRRAAAE
jgi:hypothetical protein